VTVAERYTFGTDERVALRLMQCPGARRIDTDIRSDRKPTPLPIRARSIPDVLKAEHRWVIWQYVWKDGTTGRSAKWDKPPFIATAPGSPADSTDPKTWRSFADAVGAYEDGKCDGIGFVLGDGWVGFDADGTDAPEFVEMLNTYTERSPSGSGVHAIARGTKPGTRCRTGNYELYDHGRYFTVTGHRHADRPTTVEERTAQIAALYARLFPNATAQNPQSDRASSSSVLTDDALIAKASAAKNGAK
jgi:putative DNA primase/helicase